MALLAAVNYDPDVLVTKSFSSAVAMTALDTTNLRLTFNAPDSGSVLVRLRGVIEGSSTMPRILFGILEGSTVRMRLAPTGTSHWYTSGTSFTGVESVFVQTQLTAGTAYTWDAAYGVEATSSYSALKYGGPDDLTIASACGAFVFEVWEA